MNEAVRSGGGGERREGGENKISGIGFAEI